MKKFAAALVVIIIVGLAVFVLIQGGFGGGGGGLGTGGESGDVDTVSKVMPADPEPAEETPEEPKASVIRIDGDEIYFDDALCKDENELKDRIIEIGSEREYRFVYDDAIKGTYDKVRAVLSELEDALDITVVD